MGRPVSVPRAIGPALVRARRRGICWKRLEARYNAGRKTLWKLWREAGGQPVEGDGRAKKKCFETS